MLKIPLVVILLFLSSQESLGIVAFPGAEGEGALSVGGRGGTTCEVTNLNDSGAGSLRACVIASGARTVVFRIGGNITLNSTLTISNPFITIAGQTAPGGGITLKGPVANDLMVVQTHDVIIRYIRIRPGPTTAVSCCGETLTVNGGYNIIVDHVSNTWSSDQTLTVFWESGDSPAPPHNLTFQWITASDALNCPTPGHTGGICHAYGPIFGGYVQAPSAITMHHSMIIHATERLPRLFPCGTFEFTNNVMYDGGGDDNWSVLTNNPCTSSTNYINNYVKSGPSTNITTYIAESSETGNPFHIYETGTSLNGTPALTLMSAAANADRVGSPNPVTGTNVPVTTTSAASAYSAVLADVGASKHLDCSGHWSSMRDAIDTLDVNDTINRTGGLINDPSQVGGWPTLAPGVACTDTDHDGMPDVWEIANGLNPNNPADANFIDPATGYTNLEVYLSGGSLTAPVITGVGVQGLTTTSAEVYWTAGFYHDTPTDVTLTDGFTSSICTAPTLHVSSTANMKGYVQGNIPTSVLFGGIEWGRVASVVDATHAVIEMDCTGIGASDLTEAFYSTRAGLSITVASNLATATLYYPLPAWWIAGHHFLIHYARAANLSQDTYTIATRIDDTHFTFVTSGVANGTYNSTTDPDIWLESGSGTVHAPGETISFLGTDNMVCYGNPGGGPGVYPNFTQWREDGTQGYPQAAQSSKHYAYIFGATPGSTVHYIVLSTPRQLGVSNCASIGANTGQSPDSVITFPASEQTTPIPPTGVTFSTALPTSFVDSKVVGVDCADMQTCLNTVRASAGNHELRVTANTTITAPTDNWTLPPQTNGSLVTVIRTTASNVSLPTQGTCLPPLLPNQLSPCIDNPIYASQIATLQMAVSASDPSSPQAIFHVADYTNANGFHIGPGLKLQSNPHSSYPRQVALIELSHQLGGGQYGHAYHTSNFIIDRVIGYQLNIQNGAIGLVNFQGGNSNAVVDSVLTGTLSRNQDQGGINFADEDLLDGGYIVANNRIAGGSMPIFFGDSGWNTKNWRIQQNWLHLVPEWHWQTLQFLSQVNLGVASATAGSTTTLTLSDPSEFAYGYDFSKTSLRFKGATGNWTGLNTRDFQIVDGTLTDFRCDGSNCTTKTSIPHGLATGQTVHVMGLQAYPCHFENGPHTPITVDSTTQFHYASGTVGQCLWSQVSVSGPVFLPGLGSNTTVTIPFVSTGFGALTGTVVASYGAGTDVKNTSECKTCKLGEISGNIFEYSIGNQQQAAGFSLTNRIAGSWQDVTNIASQGTISDINFHDNWFRDFGAWLIMGGIQDNGSSIPAARVRFSNLLATDSTLMQCLAGQNCSLAGLLVQYGLHYTFDHLSAFTPAAAMTAATTTPPAYGDISLTNSVLQFGAGGLFGGGDINGNPHVGAQMFLTSGTGAQPNPPYPNSLTWGRNTYIGDYCFSALGCTGGDAWGFKRSLFDGATAGSIPIYQQNFWPIYASGVGLAGLTTITGASNTSPIVLSTTTMACVPVQGDRVMVTGVTGNYNSNGTWVVANGATPNSIPLAATVGNAAYVSGGTVIALTGTCNVSNNWALSNSSPYRAGTTYIAPAADLSTAGQGAALDGTNVGANIIALNAAINGNNPNPCVNQTFSPSSIHVGVGGGTGTFNVTVTDQTCSRNLTASIVSCTANCTGTGNTTGVGWSMPVNAGGARIGTLTSPSGTTFTVTQDGVTPVSNPGSPASTVGSRTR